MKSTVSAGWRGDQLAHIVLAFIFILFPALLIAIRNRWSFKLAFSLFGSR